MERPHTFTIGDTVSYMTAMKVAEAAGEVMLKTGRYIAGEKGRTNDYPGGIVFRTVADARKYLAKEVSEKHRKAWGVFEMDADWEHDCYQKTDEQYWRNLIYDRPIIKLVKGYIYSGNGA